MKRLNYKQFHKSSLAHQKRKELEKRRIKGARLLKKGKTKSEVARILGVSPEAVRQWSEILKKEGIEGLKSKGKPGPKPRLTEADKEKIKEAILKGPQAFGYTTALWTLKRITHLIKKVAKVKYHPGYVWYILRSLGFTCQRPKVKNKHCNEAEILAWKRNSWPAIKKRGKN
jgi:transposase